MSSSVTVHSKDANAEYEIVLTKIGADTGTVETKTTTKKSTKKDKFPLYNLRTADGKVVTCLANVFGPDPKVTFNIGADSISVTVEGAMIGNGVTKYKLSSADVTAILDFVKACGFKK